MRRQKGDIEEGLCHLTGKPKAQLSCLYKPRRAVPDEDRGAQASEPGPGCLFKYLADVIFPEGISITQTHREQRALGEGREEAGEASGQKR